MNPFETKHGVSFGWDFELSTVVDGGAIHTIRKNIKTNTHSFRDFGLFPCGIVIDPPTVATSGIYVPGMDGEIDTTASLDGVVHYKNRKATFKFKAIDAKNSYIETYHKLLRILHGQTASVVLDDDPRGYYTGRWSVDKPEYDSKLGVAYFTITGNCKPYQYDYLSTGHPWLWYPFRFARDSIRRNYNAITIAGTGETEITVIPSELPVVPNITVLSVTTGVTGVKLTYTPIYSDEEKSQNLLYGVTDNRAALGDLILCSLRDDAATLKFSLTGTVGDDSEAVVCIDFETGRL